ncbi:hypothetical protein, partial [Streptobacillus moniliformis]|uniref:hypothetical protein n=1 Tax=Streptobacillus moniliformis TaxID=34105 RepID=UPI0018C861D0
HALFPITAVLRRNADTLLDLRECAQSTTRPGLCMSCDFALREALVRSAPPSGEFLLCPLRNWLEERIEIRVSDEAQSTLERLPVRLGDAPDLETYCRKVMDELREDRSYPGARISLEFQY